MKFNPVESKGIFFVVPLLLLGGLLPACGSFDLGSAKPTEIAVNSESPTWGEDIQPLMALKCMNCHASPKPKHAPKGTPALDFANNSIFNMRMSQVAYWVFKKCSVMMPPLYATPLSTAEKSALQKYLKSRGIDSSTTTKCTSVEDSKSETPALALSVAYVNTCKGCHGSQGEGGTGKKLSGTKLSEATFIATVRSGKTGMPAYNGQEISDSDLKADYAQLKKAK
jgi:mono/diheme cytochrome c family protein